MQLNSWFNCKTSNINKWHFQLLLFILIAGEHLFAPDFFFVSRLSVALKPDSSVALCLNAPAPALSRVPALLYFFSFSNHLEGLSFFSGFHRHFPGFLLFPSMLNSLVFFWSNNKICLSDSFHLILVLQEFMAIFIPFCMFLFLNKIQGLKKFFSKSFQVIPPPKHRNPHFSCLLM